MQSVDTPHPPGSVIIPCSELQRYTDFFQSVLALQLPKGSAVMVAKSSDVVKNLNNGLRKLVGEWAFILGDDHTFPPDIVLRLLDRQLDYVAPLCSTRAYPHMPLVFRETGKAFEYEWVNWEELPTSGVFEVPACSGVGLVRKYVLDVLGDPWFVAGSGAKGVISEDLGFQRRMREAGFRLYVDVDHPIGHTGVVTIEPHRDQDGFRPFARMGGTSFVALPRPHRGDA